MRDLAAGLDVDIDAPAHDTLRPSVKDVDGITLVDDDGVPATCPDDALLTHEGTELARSVTQPSAAKTGEAIANLTLGKANVQRAVDVRAAFVESDDPSEVGEQLLHELVAGELAVALQLQDIEGAMASLLGKTITNPKLTVEVAKGLREAVALSNAVRRRMENSLSAAAALRAQRLLLAAQRGRSHV